jgi:hypothetical protein
METWRTYPPPAITVKFVSLEDENVFSLLERHLVLVFGMKVV